MGQTINGHLVVRRGARLHKVYYQRCENYGMGCLPGSSILVLVVREGDDELMRFERGHWIKPPMTDDDREILREIEERVK